MVLSIYPIVIEVVVASSWRYSSSQGKRAWPYRNSTSKVSVGEMDLEGREREREKKERLERSRLENVWLCVLLVCLLAGVVS